MTEGGLLIGGVVVPVDGVKIHNPRDTKWARLNPRDYRMRRTTWVRAVVEHTTKGIWPQQVIPGAGPPGKAELVAKFWDKDPTQSAAQIIVDNDGSAACLADLATVCAYHAGTSNDWTVGIETYQMADGSIYAAAVASMVRITLAVCQAFSIPLQMHGPYHGTIVSRLKDGGADCVGIYGHRDQAWKFPWQLTPEKRAKHPNGYADRGRGDPGDHVMTALERSGVEPFDYEAREDLTAWKRRQAYLNKLGELLPMDGIAGPATMKAMWRRGFVTGRQLDFAALY